MKWPQNIELWAAKHRGHMINRLFRIYVTRWGVVRDLRNLKAEGQGFDEAVKTLFARWVAEQRLK